MRRLVWLVIWAVLFAGCGSVAPTTAPVATSPSLAATAPASTVPSIAPTVAPSTTSPSPSGSQGDKAWRSVGPTAGLQGSVAIAAVGWFKDRWVALGSTVDGTAAWWSTDGMAWQRGDIQPGATGAGTVSIAALTTAGDVAVAVGSWHERSSGGSIDFPIADSGPATVGFAVGTGEAPRVVTTATCEGMASADAAVLTSTDGASWTRVPDSRALRGQPMLGITVRDGGFVAAGGADGSGRSASWTSPDGLHWTRGSDDAALHAGWIGDVAVLGDAVIAVGGSACGNLLGVPRGWRSADGRSWSLSSALIAGACCGSAGHVAVGGTVAVADGVVATQDGGESTWTSTDGSHWTIHRQPDQTQLGPIVATPDGFLAAGSGIWGSGDGVTWTSLVPADKAFNAIAVGPNGALAVGDEIWIGPATIAPH